MKPQENRKKRNKINKNIYTGLAVAFALLGIICIVLNIVLFNFSAATIVNIVFIAIVATIFSTIFFFIGRSFEKGGKSKNEYQTDEPFENFRCLDTKEKVKKFFISLGILIMCGIGYIPLFLIASNNTKKMHSSQFFKTTAYVGYVNSDGENSWLTYVYQDLDGTVWYSESGASWGGATFKEGKKVTLYYNVHSPEVVIMPSDTFMAYFGASFFLIMGLFAFFAQMELASGTVAGTFFSLVFLLFSTLMTTGIELASGLSFFELMGSGASVYALTCFGIVGLLLFIFCFTQTIKQIKYVIKKSRIPRIKESKTKVKPVTAEKNEIIAGPQEAKPKKIKKRYHHKFFAQTIGIMLAGLVFFSVGLFMIIGMGIVPAIKYSKFVQTEATIVSLNTYTGKEGNLLASFNYEYFVNGVRYEKESSYGQSVEIAPLVGDKVKIKYNPNNPDEIKDGGWIDTMTAFVGIIPLGVGIGLFIATVIMSRTDEYYKD